ncbi:MAG TPA: MogA/MoaB family molybdenum cofactor biosynthesis protein [Planctomycetota bacterium]|nr:MogA/MoaB family molybdenum cofactor biosynthesis protein [Planctomycetota bacterium]
MTHDHGSLTESSSPPSRDQSWSFVVVTVSDASTLETDRRGQWIADLFASSRHRVRERVIVPDDPEKLALVLEHWLASELVDGILVTGGTGVASAEGTSSPRRAPFDSRTSVDVARERLDREIPGFAELFRMLSHRHIGSGAMLISAIAGFARGKLLVVLPGSLGAVELAMEELILPELDSLLRDLRPKARE